jgi:hypothetical protein
LLPFPPEVQQAYADQIDWINSKTDAVELSAVLPATSIDTRAATALVPSQPALMTAWVVVPFTLQPLAAQPPVVFGGLPETDLVIRVITARHPGRFRNAFESFHRSLRGQIDEARSAKLQDAALAEVVERFALIGSTGNARVQLTF